MCPDKNADPMPCLPRNTVCSFLVEEKHFQNFISLYCPIVLCTQEEFHARKITVRGFQVANLENFGTRQVYIRETVLLWREKNVVISGKYFPYK